MNGQFGLEDSTVRCCKSYAVLVATPSGPTSSEQCTHDSHNHEQKGNVGCLYAHGNTVRSWRAKVAAYDDCSGLVRQSGRVARAKYSRTLRVFRTEVERCLCYRNIGAC